MADLMSEPTWEYGENKIYDTNASSGFTFLGDAWNPLIPWQGDTWGRYLKGRPGGIAGGEDRPASREREPHWTADEGNGGHAPPGGTGRGGEAGGAGGQRGYSISY